MDIIKLFSGGFPVTIETLEFLQNAYAKPISALSKMAGDKAILDGIVTNILLSTVSEGYFTKGKEVIFFKACATGANIYIKDKTVQVPYNEDIDNDGNLDLKDAYVTRYADTVSLLAADEVLIDTIPFTDLVRISDFRNLTPVGAAMFWFDALNIPAGWAVCDGTNGTPDLRDKFIKMAGTEGVINTTGGSRTKTLATTNLPAHTHAQTAHTHIYSDIFHSEVGGSVGLPGNMGSGDTDGDNAGYQITRTTASGGGGNTSSVGSGTAFNIEPNYYVAILIQFKGL